MKYETLNQSTYSAYVDCGKRKEPSLLVKVATSERLFINDVIRQVMGVPNYDG